MHANALSRVMLLRQTLLQHGDAEAVQDLLQHANTLMQMLLKHEVAIDLGSTGRENTLLAKVAQLVQLGAGIGDEELRARVAAFGKAGTLPTPSEDEDEDDLDDDLDAEDEDEPEDAEDEDGDA
jgi:hypothetical protein